MEARIWESKNEKLLGLIVDGNLNFDHYVSSLCKKTDRKLSTLARTSRHASFKKKRTLLKAFVKSRFGYNPLKKIFHNRKTDFKINYIHEKALKIVYNDNISSFEELLKEDNSFNIHHRNIQSLILELIKVKNNISNRIKC